MLGRECQKFCVRDFCEGVARHRRHNYTSLLGRIERSSPKAAQRRAAGAGLDGEDADQAIMDVTAMSEVTCPGIFGPVIT